MVQGFLDFVKQSPAAFQAARAFSEMLAENGFTYLNETQQNRIERGGKYFVTRNQSAVIAFTVPETGFAPFQMIASHSDSPTFKLKSVFEDKSLAPYVKLNVEKYGGAIFSTWLDRPLGIAGRVAVKTDKGISMRLVDLQRDAVLIPNMPIHFARDINDGFKFSVQKDLMPVYGLQGAEGSLAREIAACADCDAKDVIASDLYLYNRTPASVWGANGEMFSCGRIDDLECAYTSMRALIASDFTKNINVCAVLDNEEVGSCSRQGADSDFLLNTLWRIGLALGATDAEIRANMARGFMVSADNAHAVHPNHPEKFDAQNRVYMNRGIVIKQNASQSYTTDSASDAVFMTACNVPCQHFANHSDERGGGTLGAISSSHVSVCSVDIGLAQLAMHSSYETAGTKDVATMIEGLTNYYNTPVAMVGDGEFAIG